MTKKYSIVEVYVDGASAGNPGRSGAGVFINYKDGLVEYFSIPLGEISNHEAEYQALIEGLKICLSHGITRASFRTDSKLLDDAIEKRFVKNALYKQYLHEALTYIDQFELFFLKWIPSSQNKTADQLARKAIRKN